MNRLILLVLLVALTGCSGCPAPSPSPDATPPAPEAGAATTAIVSNMTDAGATVNVSFGSDSVVQPSSWPFCGVDAGLTCTFPLAASSSQALPSGGQYLNVSIAFNGLVGCGSTIAEFTANSPKGYGTADVSLVNGWNADVQITVGGQTLGPATSGDNSKVSGVFPYGCDICVARQLPPCGIDAGGCTTPGSCGCKSGTQYNPTVPCQITYEAPDASSFINVTLVP